MKIPTILADSGIRTGSTGAPSSSADFGGDISQAGQQLASGLQRFSTGAQELEGTLAAKKHIEDTMWASESVEQEKAYINKWMADPANNTKETFADDLHAQMQSRLDEYGRIQGVSPFAQKMFKTRFLEFMSPRYESALMQATKTRLQNGANSIDQQSANIIDSWRHARETPYVDANTDLMNDIGNANKTIDTTFGTIAPATATKLKDKVVSDAAYATMRDDPDLARKVLATSKTMDEHERFVISDHIDQAERSKNVVERVTFDQRRQDYIAAAQLDKQRGKIDLKEYQSYYPRDTALQLKLKDDAVIDLYNKSNQTYNGIKAWNSGDQQLAIKNLQDKASTADDRDLLDIIAQKVSQNVKLQQQDPVGWMQLNNPRVHDAHESAAASTDNQRIQKLGELYDVSLKYQGSPPPGDPESKMYLNLPSNERHLMSVSEAKTDADKINQGSPQQMLDLINQVMGRYPDPRHQSIAFNDLVTLPPSGQGIKKEYQLAFLNRNAPWVDSYLGATANSKDISKIQPEKRADYEKELLTNSDWRAFAETTMGDDFQRSGEVEAWKSGILNFAYGISTRDNKSPKASIAEAAGKLIREQLGFTKVNGGNLMVMRDQGPGKPYRTDDDMQTISDNLMQSLARLDVREIKDTDRFGRSLFPSLSLLSTPEKKHQALRNAIMTNGRFQSSGDGQSATIYYHDGQNHFELRDQNDLPFRIRYEDIQSPWIWRVPGTPGSIDPKYSLYGVGTESTNWPKLPWMQHGGSGGLPLVPRKFRPYDPSTDAGTPPD